MPASGVDALYGELRRRGFRLSADGADLVVSPASHLTGPWRHAIHTHKVGLLAKLRESGAAGLRVEWAQQRGWLLVHDPFTDEVHEVQADDAPPWFKWRAMDAKAARRVV